MAPRAIDLWVASIALVLSSATYAQTRDGTLDEDAAEAGHPGDAPAASNAPAADDAPAASNAPAADDAPAAGDGEHAEGEPDGHPRDPDRDDDAYESTTRASRPRHPGVGSSGRSSSRVERRDMEERLPRSSPDALRYEPGVYVQQTAQSQGSAYIRGLTGQQTVIVFDDVRMNTSLYRQGPNQYFFTIDAQTLESVEVIRGSSSVFYGSDALGGVLLAYPVEPRRDPRLRGLHVAPRGFMRLSTADHGGGFRLQLEAQLGPRLTAMTGVGYRHFGMLRANGLVIGESGEPARVPTLIDDGDGGLVTLGTGFGELTFDGRVSYRLDRRLVLTTALYGYRQYDAPRTDQCPAPFAPLDECLTYDEQFRTIASIALRGRFGVLHDVNVSLSYQQQHELRTRAQPDLLVETIGRDDVDTFGVTARASSPALAVAPDAFARLTFGGDLYRDHVASAASLVFTDIDRTRDRSRGQYLDGSQYTNLGTFGQVELRAADRVTVRAGVRGAAALVDAPGDDASGTRAVRQTFAAFVTRVGAQWEVLDGLSLFANTDEAFRAPNLDDLTSRQQTGPGFQLENPDLRPERSRTIELGARATARWLGVEAWVFHTWIRDAIVRELRGMDACPQETPQCAASWSRVQLVNASGEARMHGFEASVRARLPGGVSGRGSLSYARGEAYDRGLMTRVPMSRVPPLHGSIELRWSPPWTARHVYVGAAMRWALAQTRLAPTDHSDGRIPPGGTPGYTVFDLRAGARLDRFLAMSVVVENVLDTTYRVHGSSVNGAPLGLLIALEGGL